MATKAGQKAEQAGDSTSLKLLARVGLIAYGGVHLMVGWLALQIAWGASGSKSADSSGALRTVADCGRPGGARPVAGQCSHLGLSQIFRMRSWLQTSSNDRHPADLRRGGTCRWR
jgi:hypothetical protein